MARWCNQLLFEYRPDSREHLHPNIARKHKTEWTMGFYYGIQHKRDRWGYLLRLSNIVIRFSGWNRNALLVKWPRQLNYSTQT